VNSARKRFAILWFATFFLAASLSAGAPELVYIDNVGVMRWVADHREVALFGANYCLPSSGDYRAAGYVGSDRKKLIEHDVAHFARMGWDGLRLALWGDWENSDRAGNLIANDHLDLLDYLIFQAKQRGISMLLTPIHRHSALWPDGKDSDAIQGFSKYYAPSQLGINPAAIAAQKNYLRQLLTHINPYTGVALKDEPAILFIELINEPEHHSSDFAGSVAYINALVEAVRSTGCEKLLFHNLSQDFAMAPAIAASKAQGFTFGWYPTALVSGHTLKENYLRWVDEYTPLKAPEIPRLPRIVYEFDSADMTAGYMYPAMVRAFREVGAQFAAMFAYDMLDTAPYNLGWQTHYLNLVYSPTKAVSAIIAAEAMRTLPRGVSYGVYPDNRRFGPFRVSSAEDLSEMVTAKKFLYANTTATVPPDSSALEQVVGCGSSPVVDYEGRGSYFLDKLSDGLWRLEVYPDAVFVQDPFAQRLNYQSVSSRLVWRTWSMEIRLPDLGTGFSVTALNAGNSHRAEASAGSFKVRPGVYLLSRHPQLDVDRSQLPARIGQVKLEEFTCPAAPDLPPQTVFTVRESYVAGQPLVADADIVAAVAPESVRLHVRTHQQPTVRTYKMNPTRGFGFRAVVPAADFSEGQIELAITVDTLRFPGTGESAWKARVVAPNEPLRLFDGAVDGSRLFAMRNSGDHRGNYFEPRSASLDSPAVLRLAVPAVGGENVVSLPIKMRIDDRGVGLQAAKKLRVAARGMGDSIRITLVESDGTGWSCTGACRPGATTVDLPLAAFQMGGAAKLPLGYPGNWNNRLLPSPGRESAGGRLRLDQIEHVQIQALPAVEGQPDLSRHIDVASIDIVFE
jgi:hypothetical protein